MTMKDQEFTQLYLVTQPKKSRKRGEKKGKIVPWKQDHQHGQVGFCRICNCKFCLQDPPKIVSPFSLHTKAQPQFLKTETLLKTR